MPPFLGGRPKSWPTSVPPHSGTLAPRGTWAGLLCGRWIIGGCWKEPTGVGLYPIKWPLTGPETPKGGLTPTHVQTHTHSGHPRLSVWVGLLFGQTTARMVACRHVAILIVSFFLSFQFSVCLSSLLSVALTSALWSLFFFYEFAFPGTVSAFLGLTLSCLSNYSQYWQAKVWFHLKGAQEFHIERASSKMGFFYLQ